MLRILYRSRTTLTTLGVRSGRSKDLEILVLRHQLTDLSRQIDRPSLTETDRSLLARLRPRSLVRDVPAGWSHPTRCCTGTADASPATEPAHTAVPDDRPPPPASAL